MSVEWKDMGLALILKNIAGMNNTQVAVGIVGEAAQRPSSDGRMTMGDVATINEYGTRDGHIPPRHFVRSALHTPLAMSLAAGVARAAITSSNVAMAYDRAGRQLAEKMKQNVERGDFITNAPETVKKKGFNHPLVDNRGLVDAIGHELIHGSLSSPIGDNPGGVGE